LRTAMFSVGAGDVTALQSKPPVKTDTHYPSTG
jgi:hypothetical protein